ncbi:outer membrane beta-barrel protein [Alteromonas hispanica]|uniref:Outer membrane beta-barrel protein n=1 Tax=Alteromonas hispanica TaxID=315421 RepID=A0A6L9MVC5_9ALTE|nr:outer membrane beta-barrel protein [Alteromonas hispanica]NDW22108.1 outer membrane beta-barrel protein [Alteromonas hispanica]
MKKLILAAALSAISAGSFAAAPAWDFVQGSYVMTDFDDSDFEYEPDGFAISASKLVTDRVFVTGDYSQQNDDIFGLEVDLDMLTLGLGYRYALSNQTDLFGIVSYEDIEVSGVGESDGEDGYGLTAGARSMVMDNVELRGAVKYIDSDSGSDTSIIIGADYFFSPAFAVGVGYEASDDLNTFALNARYNF